MLKRTITFKDLEKKPLTRDFYFNLTVPEVTELEFNMPGGMSEYYKTVIANRDAGALLRSYKELVCMAYGEKDADGITFNKINPVTGRPLGEKFLQTDAYNVLFMEMFGLDASDDAFSEFIRGCVPEELLEKMPDSLEVVDLVNQPKVIQSDSDLTEAPQEKTLPEHYTQDELVAMSDEDFDKLAGTDATKWSKHVLRAAFIRKGRSKA